MLVEHCLRLSSCVSARAECHEQDGERLPRACADVTASCDPAMAFEPCRGEPANPFGGSRERQAVVRLTNERMRIVGSIRSRNAQVTPRAEKSAANAELVDQVLVALLVRAS